MASMNSLSHFEEDGRYLPFSMSISGSESSEEPGAVLSIGWPFLGGEGLPFHPLGSTWPFWKPMMVWGQAQNKMVLWRMGSSVTQFKTLVISVSFLSLDAHPLPQLCTHTHIQTHPHTQTHTHPVSHQVLLMWIKYFVEVDGVTIMKVCGHQVLPSEHLANPVFLLHFYLHHTGPLWLVSLPLTSTPGVCSSYFL